MCPAQFNQEAHGNAIGGRCQLALGKHCHPRKAHELLQRRRRRWQGLFLGALCILTHGLRLSAGICAWARHTKRLRKPRRHHGPPSRLCLPASPSLGLPLRRGCRLRSLRSTGRRTRSSSTSCAHNSDGWTDGQTDQGGRKEG